RGAPRGTWQGSCRQAYQGACAIIGASMDDQKSRQQYVRFAFYKVDPAWRALHIKEKGEVRDELLQLVQQFGEGMILRSYSTVGTRGDCDFLLWQVAYDMDDIHRLAARVNASRIGRYLSLDRKSTRLNSSHEWIS